MKRLGIKRLGIATVLAVLLISTTPIKGHCQCDQATQKAIQQATEQICRVVGPAQCLAQIEVSKRLCASL